MEIRELAIPGSFLINPKIHSDTRGSFWEWYRFDELEKALGHSLNLRQANGSISAQGVLRGIHFADVEPGQAKYVTCVSGKVLDFVVDIRVGSPTYGQWEAVELSSVTRNAVYLAEGLGHAFLALTPDATVNYLVSGTYDPSKEHGLNPQDPVLGLNFPEGFELLLSDKDLQAPSLEEAKIQGILPTWESALNRYESLRVNQGER